MKKETMIFSDQWYIEEEKAWFLSATRNELFEADLTKKEVQLLGRISNSKEYAWRDITHCFKVGRQIICLPDTGISIWKYSLDNSEWREIPIGASKDVRLGISQYWSLEKNFLLYSSGLRAILYFSIDKEAVFKTAVIASENEESLGRAVRVGEDIYIVSSVSPKIYRYHISSGAVDTIPLLGINEGLHAICYDGEGFWLSGKKRKFYRWSEDNREATIYDPPPSFGIYNFDFHKASLLDTEAESYEFPTFLDIVYVGGQSWFIPGQTNQILYMDANPSCAHELHIPEEDETPMTIRTQYRVEGLGCKYMVLYTRDDRFIGIYSYKNACIIEIDTNDRSYEILHYDMSDVPFSSYGFRKEFNQDFLPWMCQKILKNCVDTKIKDVTLLGQDIYRKIFEHSNR